MYHYSKLGSEGEGFRLLRLLKGSGPEIECDLFLQSLQSVHLPYEALSYAWGSNELVECIKLDEKSFWITDNLHAALQNLRLRDRNRILWIDAICINQEDKVEQSHQVQQMGQIYEKAEKLLIWLGKATPQMIALMERLNQFRNADPDYHYKLETFQDWNWTDHSIAIKQILNREWFTRVWILQEAAKASRADVCCGAGSIPTEILVLALSFVKQEFPPHCRPILDIMAKSFRSKSWWAQTRDLRTLLRKFHGSKATDERDKIYALLGMSLDPLDTKSITIDYQRPTSQVIQEVIKYLLQSMQKNQSTPFTMDNVLDIMCSFTTLNVACFLPEQQITSKTIYSGLPSGYKTTKSYQTEVKFPAIACVNDPTLLLFEKKPTESLENQNTCYSQIVRLMLDQQSTRVLQEYDRGLYVLSWGNTGHHVKVVVIRDKLQAILKAAASGCDQVVRLLLRMRLGIESEEDCEALVLHDTVRESRKELLQFMLDAGADINAQGGPYGNALQAATHTSKVEIVKVLLDAGADVNAQGGHYGNALQAARHRRTSMYRDDEMGIIVKMLLNAGAEDTDQDGEQGCS